MLPANDKIRSWLDHPLPLLYKPISIEIVLFAIISLLAIISRFTALGDRALSHDESIHIYYSYLLSEGQGYTHTPLSHGPLQFHLIALLFFLFSSSDFLGRVPHAIASIVAILLVWNWRKYLGRSGAIVAAFLILISPFMLYYGRYARNEAFVVVFGLLTLYSILRYLETGKNRYLYTLTTATVLHFTVKETAFIYSAQAMLFLLAFLLFRISQLPWVHKKLKIWFFGFLVIAICLTCFCLGINSYTRSTPPGDVSLPVSPVIPSQSLETALQVTEAGNSPFASAVFFLALLGGLAYIVAGILLILGYGWKNLRSQRAFAMIVLLVTFVLPQLTAFPVSWLGLNPLDYHFMWPGWDIPGLLSQTPVKIGIVFLVLTTFSVLIGVTWNAKIWFINALIFWSIYILFFTTIFTNPAGFFTGAIGSLGYWLEQQAVRRGNQPWFYYLFLQIPLYEFLPALGLIPAIILWFQRSFRGCLQRSSGIELTLDNEKSLALSLLLWWSISSMFAFSLAGEKMPWLTVHITLPMILLLGLVLGRAIERINWQKLKTPNGIWAGVLIALFVLAASALFVSTLSSNLPLQEKAEDNRFSTGYSLFWFIILITSGISGYSLLLKSSRGDILRVTSLIAFGYLAILTARTAFRASFINVESATEYLVYAHGASGIKDSLRQIENLSQRVSGGYNELHIAYDAGDETQGVSWPWKWYLRNFPLAYPYFSVDENLLMADVIVADPQSYDEVNKLTVENYLQFDSLRMVWPNQDYFTLTWEKLQESVSNQQTRTALFHIWYSRDYTDYSLATGKTAFQLQKWEPSDKMRLYIRKDLAQKVWEYNLTH